MTVIMSPATSARTRTPSSLSIFQCLFDETVGVGGGVVAAAHPPLHELTPAHVQGDDAGMWIVGESFSLIGMIKLLVVFDLA